MLQNNKYQKQDNYKDKIEMLNLLLKLINLEIIWYVILLGRFMINKKRKRKRNGNGKVLLGILLMDWIIAQVVIILIIIIIMMILL